jgi:hypothetical protein
LEINLTNQNCIHAKIKSRLNSGNACYNLVQNRLSSCSLSKNIKIKIHTCIILPAVLYGHKTWSFTLAEGIHEQGDKEILGPKRDEVTGDRRKLNNE